ncbi:MAG: hypothetical protein ACRC1Z_09675 [Waterburya sp.]
MILNTDRYTNIGITHGINSSFLDYVLSYIQNWRSRIGWFHRFGIDLLVDK